jgi:hypothetical protein
MGPELMRKFGTGKPYLCGESIRDAVDGRRDGDVGRVVNRDGMQPW